MGLLKCLYVDDSGDAALDPHVLVLIDPDVFFILEDCTEAVVSEWATVQGPQSLLIQGMDDLGLSLSANVPLKHLPDDGGTLWVDLKLLVRSGTITEWPVAPGTLALRGTDP